MFGSATTNAVTQFCVDFYINNNGQFSFIVGSANPILAAGDTDRHTVVIDVYHSSYSMDGCSSTSMTVGSYADSPRPLAIFGRHGKDDDTKFVYCSKMRLYAFRIREAGLLKHEFVPCKQNGVIGLYDTVDKIFKPNTVSGANAFTLSGKGVGGVERWLVEPANASVSKGSHSTVTLNACAAGAQSYRWTRNGEAIAGGEDGSLTVAWHRHGSTDTYAVTAVYSVFGCDVAGDPITCTVENQPQGTVLVIR